MFNSNKKLIVTILIFSNIILINSIILSQNNNDFYNFINQIYSGKSKFKLFYKPQNNYLKNFFDNKDSIVINNIENFEIIQNYKTFNKQDIEFFKSQLNLNNSINFNKKYLKNIKISKSESNCFNRFKTFIRYLKKNKIDVNPSIYKWKLVKISLPVFTEDKKFAFIYESIISDPRSNFLSIMVYENRNEKWFYITCFSFGFHHY